MKLFYGTWKNIRYSLQYIHCSFTSVKLFINQDQRTPKIVYFMTECKFHPITVHKDSEGEYRYCFTLPSNSALEGMDGQRHAPAALNPEKPWYPLYKRLGGQQGRSGRVRKTPQLPGFDPRTIHLVAN